MFDTVDFFKYVWPFVLFKKFCEMCKTICIHKSIFNNKSNDRKRINNYLNFLNKMNGQTCFKKSTALNILRWREYLERREYYLRSQSWIFFFFSFLFLLRRRHRDAKVEVLGAEALGSFFFPTTNGLQPAGLQVPGCGRHAVYLMATNRRQRGLARGQRMNSQHRENNSTE